MAASTAVRFQVVETGSRRVVTVSPAARPDATVPVAHPARPASPRRVRPAASCAVRRPVEVPRLLGLKVAVIGAVAVVGMIASTAQFVQNVQPDPAQGYVAGDPAWAHVAQP